MIRSELSESSKAKFELNPDTPVAQKVADELFFRRLQGERENTNFRLPSSHSSVGFISRSCFNSDGFIAY